MAGGARSPPRPASPPSPAPALPSAASFFPRPPAVQTFGGLTKFYSTQNGHPLTPRARSGAKQCRWQRESQGTGTRRASSAPRFSECLGQDCAAADTASSLRGRQNWGARKALTVRWSGRRQREAARAGAGGAGRCGRLLRHCSVSVQSRHSLPNTQLLAHSSAIHRPVVAMRLS